MKHLVVIIGFPLVAWLLAPLVVHAFARYPSAAAVDAVTGIAILGSLGAACIVLAATETSGSEPPATTSRSGKIVPHTRRPG